MNAQQLRNSILQEAIEGRLVPQDPNDEPASVLLERIREEKKRLFKEGKLKKKDLEETPISEDEKPFEIPKSWEWVRVKEVFSINPKVVADDNADAAFIPMEKIEACYGSRFSYEIRKWKTIKSSFTCFADGDVAFAKITPCFQNRKSMILKNLPNGIGAGTTELKVLRQYAETIVREYLLYFLASSYFIDEATFKGTANQQRIIVGYLENKLFPLPPLAEQKRIVAKIEELLPKVEEYGKAQDALNKLNEELPDRLKKSILQEAIEGRLVPQDPNDEPASVLLNRIREEKKRLYKAGLLKKKEIIEREIYEDEVPFTLPDGWLWTKIDNVAFVTKLAGFEYTKYIADNLVPKENGIPLFKGKNVQNGKIVYEFEAYIPVELSNELKRSQINKKCLLTPYVGTIGNIGIHDKSGVYHLGSNVGKIEFYNGDNLNILEEYVKYYLMSSYGYDELTKYKKATAQESISIEAIRDVFLPLPPLAEQHRIVEKIEEVFKEIDKLKK